MIGAFCFFSVGDSQPIDVSSVHHQNMFLKYSVSLLGYGFYGDTLLDSEKNRWMGPSRYDFSGNLDVSFTFWYISIILAKWSFFKIVTLNKYMNKNQNEFKHQFH